MRESSPLRRWVLAIALAATVAAAGWVGGNQEGGRVALVATGDDAREARSEAREAPAATTGTGGEGAAIDLDRLKQRAVTREFGEMFPSRQPELPPEARRKPEPPRAPPLPFQFFGRLVENGTTMVFLSRQDDVFTVKAGDTLAGSYRVEEINGTEIVLTYLPLNQRQTMRIGDIN